MAMNIITADRIPLPGATDNADKISALIFGKRVAEPRPFNSVTKLTKRRCSPSRP